MNGGTGKESASLSEENSQRKEIFEFLRNAQKAQETKSKAVGLSIWGLASAAAFLAWQLIQIDRMAYSSVSLSLAIHFMAASWIAIIFASPSITDDSDKSLRFENLGNGFFRLPVVAIFRLVWFFLPLFLFARYVEIKTSLWFIPAIVLVAVLQITFEQLFGKSGRFPAPRFKRNGNGGTITVLVIFGVLLALHLQLHSAQVIHLIKTASTREFQIAVLLCTAYWLVFLLLELFTTALTSDWPHRIERQLLIGTISTRDALQQIEQRILGIRLTTVLDDFWNETAAIKNQLSGNIDQLKEVIANTESISSDFFAAGATRHQDQIRIARDTSDRLLVHYEEIITFIEKAQKIDRMYSNPAVASALKTLVKRVREEWDEAKMMAKQATTLANEASSILDKLHANH